MKSITIYESNDGTRHNSESAALSNDHMIEQVELAMRPIGPTRTIPSRKYIQHTREACRSAKTNILSIARKQWPNEVAFMIDFYEIHPATSFAARLMSECSCEPLARAWSRLARINWDNYREYEQIYYAMNPDEVSECLD